MWWAHQRFRLRQIGSTWIVSLAILLLTAFLCLISFSGFNSDPHSSSSTNSRNEAFEAVDLAIHELKKILLGVPPSLDSFNKRCEYGYCLAGEGVNFLTDEELDIWNHDNRHQKFDNTEKGISIKYIVEWLSYDSNFNKGAVEHLFRITALAEGNEIQKPVALQAEVSIQIP